MPHVQICDPACQKIIINSGLVATTAELLLAALDSTARAGEAKSSNAAIQAAEFLARHAKAYYAASRILLDHKVISATDPSGWHGCDQAAAVTRWVEGVESGMVISFSHAQTMREWGEEYRRRTAVLVKQEGD